MRSRFVAVLSITVLAVSLVLFLAGGSPAAHTHEGWTRLATGGIDNPGVKWTAPIIEFKGRVYFLIADIYGPGVTSPPAPLWSYGPDGFAKAAADGFGNKNNTGLFPLAENGGYLYCGTTNFVDGGELWRSPDGESWEKIGTSGFGDPDSEECYPLGVHGGDIIVGFRNEAHGAKLYRYDGAKLSRANTDGFDMGVDDISFGVNYKGGLYVSGNNSSNETCRSLVYKGGTTWQQTGAVGFGDPNNLLVKYMMTDGEKIYAGTLNLAAGGQVWSYDGSNWAQLAANGIDDPANQMLYAYKWGGTIYVAAESFDPGVGVGKNGRVYRSDDGGEFERWVGDGLGDSDNYFVGSASVYNGRLLTGTLNPNGFQVWSHSALSDTYYFAEGTTRDNPVDGTFQEWISVENPNDSVTDVEVTYMLGTGDNVTRQYSVAANSRLTVDVAADVGPDQDVSVKVKGDKPIVAERPMYFNYHGKWTGGHVVMGAPGPSDTYYFAEGTTRNNPTDGTFEEWICIQNPGDEAATVTLTYMLGTGETVVKDYPVGAGSRYTVDVAADIGPDRDVSVKVKGDKPIVAERPMYFDYHGAWPGGHDVVGALEPANELFFAEGCTHPWADEWICIQNPGEDAATVTLTYQVTAGEQVIQTVNVPATSRRTVGVRSVVGDGKDVSVALSSTQPVVAERPMYFNYHEKWPGGHDVMGAQAASTRIYFAEGSTRNNPTDGYFDEWVCLQNPGNAAASVTVTFMKTDGTTQEYKLGLESGSRTTLDVNQILGAGVDSAILVESDLPIVAERPMYFDYHGFATGGHDTVGYGT